jgi:SAM-dependent methyltransferase
MGQLESNPKKIEDTAKQLWGRDLHLNHPAPPHLFQLEEIFQQRWTDSMKGDLLEIGCGSGTDLGVFLTYPNLKNITAIDIGATVDDLAIENKGIANLQIQRGNALSLEFNDSIFDVVYSFGIFHHTSDPFKCLQESYRVLKKQGKIFLYLYSSHEDILYKRVGIFIESSIMKFFSYLPYALQNLSCILLSPLCWLFFSAPSRIFKFFGFQELSKQLPFYFGTHPFSLVPDLKDRLMSPINHRFTKLEMESLISLAGFDSFEVVKTSSGLYIYAVKDSACIDEL